MVDEHAESVEDLAATILGGADELGAWWVGDDVGNDHVFGERIGVQFKARFGVGEANAGGVDDDIGLLWHTVFTVPFFKCGFGGRLVVEQGDEFVAAVFAAVDDGEMRGTREGAFHSDGARGTAGSEHDEAFTGGVDYFLQAFQEAFAVGVFADVFAVAADDAIDRPRRVQSLS